MEKRMRERESYAYADWFGSGNTADDIDNVIAEYGPPIRVFVDRNMAAIVYEDGVVVVGYDGNGYRHEFNCREPYIPASTPLKE
jgi:hypothetical protein